MSDRVKLLLQASAALRTSDFTGVHMHIFPAAAMDAVVGENRANADARPDATNAVRAVPAAFDRLQRLVATYGPVLRARAGEASAYPRLEDLYAIFLRCYRFYTFDEVLGELEAIVARTLAILARERAADDNGERIVTFLALPESLLGKSNMWFSAYAWTHTALKSAVDFVAPSMAAVELFLEHLDDLDSARPFKAHVLYVDDMSYSGSQLIRFTHDLEETIDVNRMTLFPLVPFVAERALGRLEAHSKDAGTAVPIRLLTRPIVPAAPLDYFSEAMKRSFSATAQAAIKREIDATRLDDPEGAYAFTLLRLLTLHASKPCAIFEHKKADMVSINLDLIDQKNTVAPGESADDARALVVQGLSTWVYGNAAFYGNLPWFHEEKAVKTSVTFARYQPAAAATDALVPQDGRDEYVGHPPYRLRAGTTLLHARVNLSDAHPSSAADIFSLFFGLTLAHPCSILINHLLIDPERPTGLAVIYEYETHAELPLKSYGYKRYDEIYLPVSPKQSLLNSMRIVRAYGIDRSVIDAAPVLAFTKGHDGREWLPRSSVPGRWREPALEESVRADGLAVRAAADRPQCDADYLHLRQFWQKQGKLMPIQAQALQVVLSGSDASGPPRMQRHGFYIYDTQRRFVFDRPVRYRDEDPDVPRADMPYAVGILVVFTGTKDYDQTPGMSETAETRRFSPIRHQANLVGLAVERGYEARVYPILDDLLASLPWTTGADGPVLARVTAADEARLPQWHAALGARGIQIESSM